MKRYPLILIVVLVVSLMGCGQQAPLQPISIPEAEAANPEAVIVGSDFYSGDRDVDPMFVRTKEYLLNYFTIFAYPYIGFPDDDPAYQLRIPIFVVKHMETYPNNSPLDVNTYLNPDTGVYTIPKDLFDPVIQGYFRDPYLDEEFLVSEGYLTPDKKNYTILIEGYGFVGWFDVDIFEAESDRVSLSLSAYWDESKTQPNGLMTFVFDCSDGYLTLIEAKHIKAEQ